MKDAKRKSKTDGIGDALHTIDRVDKTQNGFDLEGKECQRAEDARRAEEEEMLIEEKVRADREGAEARRHEQARLEQERAAKATDEEKLDAWMKTKEKGILKRKPTAQELLELKWCQIVKKPAFASGGVSLQACILDRTD